MTLLLIGAGLVFVSLFVGMATFLAGLSMPIIPRTVDAIFKVSLGGICVGVFILLATAFNWLVS